MAAVTINDLLEAGVHFGHQTKRWNPKMKPYIYGTRNGITIFDLTVTMRHLAEACGFLRNTVNEGGNVLFVGAKRQAQEAVREVAERLGMFYMCDRWLGGTLTNNRVVLSRVNYMKKLREMIADGTTQRMPKKEVSRIRRELGKLERTLGGISEMRSLPAALTVVDVEREAIAVREAKKLNIPVVAIVDSNCDPDDVDYVVPGNDDALRAIKVIIDALATAIEDGVQHRSGGRSDTGVAAAAQPSAPAETAPADEEQASGTEDAAAASEGAPAEEQAEQASEVQDEPEPEPEPSEEEAGKPES